MSKSVWIGIIAVFLVAAGIGGYFVMMKGQKSTTGSLNYTSTASSTATPNTASVSGAPAAIDACQFLTASEASTVLGVTAVKQSLEEFRVHGTAANQVSSECAYDGGSGLGLVGANATIRHFTTTLIASQFFDALRSNETNGTTPDGTFAYWGKLDPGVYYLVKGSYLILGLYIAQNSTDSANKSVKAKQIAELVAAKLQ